MNKIFNTAGLCFPQDHYMIDPLTRLTDVEKLIAQKHYFTLHAPRQTGKTTYLYALARKLNTQGNYIALVVSFERAGLEGISLEKANQILLNSIYQASLRQLEESNHPQDPTGKNPIDLYNYLHTWCVSLPKPLVLLIDEIDALMDNTLISILRQFRDGYQSRPQYFPSSIVLVGLRDVRDYKVKIREEIKSMGTASPFNIKSDSILLENFSKQEVFELLEQHTKATNQKFPLDVKEEIFRLSNGQPWLTNALAYQIVSRILDDDYSRPITLQIVEQAKNQLIYRRDTHLDSLVDKLKEKPIKRIVHAIINGDNLAFDIFDDDIVYARDLGIVSQASPLKFANPIYAEIIPRIIASPIQESIPQEIQQNSFLNSQGELDIQKIFIEFQKFYRRNSQAWIDRYEYKESAQHLLLMAFMQRIINSGGEIIREMAVGNGRIDILVKFKKQEFPLELKIIRDKYTIEDGKEQLNRYLDKLGLKEGYLILFDPGPKEWEEKLYIRQCSYNDKTIVMVGL